MAVNQDKVKLLKEYVEECGSIVFFGGAGVSTESGIPDFRSTDGLYHQEWKYPPETILSHTFFVSHTEEFYRFYRKKMLCLDAKPNAAHKKLAELEERGKLTAVVTQNIDGLQDLPGCNRGREEYRISPSGDGPGYLCKLQERTENFQKESSLRHRSDRKVFPKRDYAGQLHLPYQRV